MMEMMKQFLFLFYFCLNFFYLNSKIIENLIKLNKISIYMKIENKNRSNLKMMR